MLSNRIPTKDNVFIRGIIQVDAQLCVSGCGNVENVELKALNLKETMQ